MNELGDSSEDETLPHCRRKYIDLGIAARLLVSPPTTGSFSGASATSCMGTGYYRIALAALGPRHPSTIQALELLSTSLLSLSQYAIQRAHAAETRRILGADHPMTLQVEHTVAETLRRLDRFEDAKNLYLRVLADKTRVLGATHRSTLQTRHNLALLYKDLKEPKRAEEMLREIARLKREALRPSRRRYLAYRVRQALDRLVKLYVAWNKPEKAAEYQALLKKAAEAAPSKKPDS